VGKVLHVRGRVPGVDWTTQVVFMQQKSPCYLVALKTAFGPSIIFVRSVVGH
jgi:hypothetical protein